MSDDNSVERDRRFFIICFFNHSSFLLLFLYSIIIIVHSFESASLFFHWRFYQYNLFRIIFLILQDVVIDTTFWQISSNHHQMTIVWLIWNISWLLCYFTPLMTAIVHWSRDWTHYHYLGITRIWPTLIFTTSPKDTGFAIFRSVYIQSKYIWIDIPYQLNNGYLMMSRVYLAEALCL